MAAPHASLGLREERRARSLVVDHPLVVLAIVALLSVLAASQVYDLRTGALRLRIDPSLDRLLPPDDPDRRFYESMRRTFGNDETVLVAVASDDAFALESLRRVERLTRALERLPGVTRVASLATAPSLEEDEEGLELRSFTEAALADPTALPRLRALALSNPLYRGSLVSDDGRVSALAVSFEPIADEGFRARQIPERLRALADAESAGGPVWITGPPILKAATTEVLLHELVTTLPLIALVGALVLAVAFGNWRGVVLPLATIGLSLLWTISVLAALGHPLQLVTTLVPPLLLAVGLAYALHVTTAFFEDLPAGCSRSAAREHLRASLQAVRLPVLVTATTTVIGFLALAVTPLPAIREFGLLAVLGVAVVSLLSLTFLPASLAVVGAGRGARRLPWAGPFDRAAEALARFDLRHRRRIFGTAIAIACVALAFSTQIRVGTSYVGDFDATHPARADFEAVSRAFGGVSPFSIVLEAHLAGAFVDPEILAEVQKLQDWLAAQPEVVSTQSVTDHLRLLHRILRGEDLGAALPATQRLAKQLLVMGGGDEVDAIVHPQHHTAQIVVRTRAADTATLDALLARVEERVAGLPLPLSGRVTGSSVLVSRTIERVTQGQVASTLLALAAIYAVMVVLFTSFRMGLLALLPNLLPIAIYYGALGFFGITLNPSTALIGCITLGIAVDDTIHYFVRFQREARRTASEERATYRALEGVLRPATFTSLALCACFLVLTTSELRNHVEFGLLSAFTLAVARVSDVTVTPALCAGARLVTLWDVLRLDLGDTPERSIPLFAGLSARQARIFALTADLQQLPAGTLLMREGADPNEMFLVLEGELRLWTTREGRRVDLRGATRGAVIGHAGLFLNRRFASADTVTAVRVLRFTEEDLQLMVRRHPRIAAHLYRNLSYDTAAMLAGTIARLG